MTAPSASEDLKDFVCNPSLPRFLSHIQNGHLYFYPALAAERDCVPAFFFFFFFASLIPGYCLGGEITPNLAQQTPTGSSYSGILFSLRFQLREVGVSRVISQEQCVQRGQEIARRRFEKHQAPISAHLFRDPRETALAASHSDRAGRSR